jgi:sortase A
MKRHLYKFIVLTIVLVAALGFVGTLVRSSVVAHSSETDSGLTPISISTTTASMGYATTSSSNPTHIRIPKINIDAKVSAVGLGKTGNMAVPYTYEEAGWYRFGTLPGQVGSAVLDGHVDNGLGVPAIFARLGELMAGDDIYIDNAQGQTLHFVVEEASTYPVAEVPLVRLFNRDDAPRLNLITCKGTWLPEKKMYDERHVVYAVLAQ